MKLFMYERYQLYKTKLVDITDNTYLKISNCRGDIQIFYLEEMLVMDCLVETDDQHNEYQSVIYRGKIKIDEASDIKKETYFFKYIPVKEQWYICGDISGLFNKNIYTFLAIDLK